MLPLLATLACQSAAPVDQSALAPQLSLHPTVAGRGTDLTLYVDATGSAFSFEGTDAELGQGIDIRQVDVDDVYGLRLALSVADDADLGKRDLAIETGDRSFLLEQAFEVIDQSFTISPDSAAMGETVQVAFSGTNTGWESGRNYPAFGDGVEVLDFAVLGPADATGIVVVQPDAEPGRRDVAMQEGSEQLLAPEAFLVDRVGIAAEFSPATAEQGDVLSFKVEARGTDFSTGLPDLVFMDAAGDTSDVVVDSVTVIDSNSLVGQISVSNAASPGLVDLRVLTEGRGVLITDALEVLASDWSIDDVAIDLRFHVDRALDNETGALSESVTAYCEFYIPLDPDCPADDSAGTDLGAPDPYDRNEVFAAPEAELSTDQDCPEPRTVPAGDVIWLESDANIITLDRTEDEAAGSVYYIARDLPLADYVLDNVYDLHTQGQEDGIGEYLLEGVQPTVPSDWSVLAPDLWGNDLHSRSEDLCLEWTPAQTYPDATFIWTLWSRSSPGPLVKDGYVGYLGVVPWDDGYHCIEPADLAILAPGLVPVTIYAYDEGPDFGLPGSQYDDNEARTWIALRASLVLE